MGSLGPRNQNGSASDPVIKAHLAHFLVNKYDRQHPIVQFVKAVWGFDATDIPVRTGGYSLDELACKQYLLGTYKVTPAGKHVQHSKKKAPLPKPGERDAYEPLMAIFADLIGQARKALQLDDNDHRAKLVNMRDRVMKGQYAEFKPDFVWSWVEGELSQLWTHTAVCGELKKEKGDADGVINTLISLDDFQVVRVTLTYQ